MESTRILRCGPALALVVAGTFAAAILAGAQTQSAQKIEHFTATAVNVTGAPDPVKIDLLRWSTDAEREQLVSAFTDKGEKEFTAALSKAPTLGYIWTSESAGYTVRYACRTSAPDGSQRLVFVTEKPLGSWNPQIWKPTAAAKGNNYEFTVVELRLNPKGVGEGKSSLFAKVVADKAAKTIALDNYTGSQIVLKDAKWENSGAKTSS